MKPLNKDGKWICGHCGGYIDTGFIEQPRRCENEGCGWLIDWGSDGRRNEMRKTT